MVLERLQDLYKFMSNGSLKGYLLPYFKFIGGTMARRGLTPVDSAGYGFYNVRLRESLRQYLLPDSTTIDTNAVEIGEDDMMTADGMQDKSKNLFDRLFGGSKKDTAKVQSTTDTVRNNKQSRKERQKEMDKHGN